MQEDKIAGVLLGTAIGDALGLHREGLHPKKALRLYGDAPLRYNFILGRGMVSDDTEHTCMLAQSLLAAPDDSKAFGRALGWRLRGWLCTLPAGMGLATLRATVRLCIGFSPEKSGVFSAGNGPAMRAALLGVCLGSTPQRLEAFVRASTRLTHTDPRAFAGALVVARAAYEAAQASKPLQAERMIDNVCRDLPDPELIGLLMKAKEALRRGDTATEFAASLGLADGVTGFMYHTVPVAIFCWLRHPEDFRSAIEAAILLGGDADTTGAIVGALAGATIGAKQLPKELIEGLWEWPRSVSWMRRLATRLSLQFPETGEAQRQKPLSLFWPAIVPRNILFLLGVLAYGFRRLLPR